MLKKNVEKEKRKNRRSFIGIRPDRFKPKKGAYDRKQSKKEGKEEIKNA